METLYQWVLDMDGNIECHECRILHSRHSTVYDLEERKYVDIKDPSFDKIAYTRVYSDGKKRYYVKRNEIGVIPSTFSSSKVLVTYESDFEAAVRIFVQALEHARDYHMDFVESFNKQITQLLWGATLV